MAQSDTVQLNMPTYEQMLEAGMHLGRKQSVFNPNMKPYIYTEKDSLHIIDLIKTQENLVKAVQEMQKIVDNGGQILFAGITKQSRDAVKELADELEMPYVQDRWIGGTISNFKTIMGRVKDMKDLGEKLKSAEMEKYVKKERLEFEREYEKMEEKFGGLRRMNKIPDLVFVASASNSMVAVRESRGAGVKIAGITNTDGDPRLLDFPIPASDSSKQSVELILEAIKKSVKKKS